MVRKEIGGLSTYVDLFEHQSQSHCSCRQANREPKSRPLSSIYFEGLLRQNTPGYCQYCVSLTLIDEPFLPEPFLLESNFNTTPSLLSSFPILSFDVIAAFSSGEVLDMIRVREENDTCHPVTVFWSWVVET